MILATAPHARTAAEGAGAAEAAPAGQNRDRGLVPVAGAAPTTKQREAEAAGDREQRQRHYPPQRQCPLPSARRPCVPHSSWTPCSCKTCQRCELRPMPSPGPRKRTRNQNCTAHRAVLCSTATYQSAVEAEPPQSAAGSCSVQPPRSTSNRGQVSPHRVHSRSVTSVRCWCPQRR